MLILELGLLVQQERRCTLFALRLSVDFSLGAVHTCRASNSLSKARSPAILGLESFDKIQHKVTHQFTSSLIIAWQGPTRFDESLCGLRMVYRHACLLAAPRRCCQI